ncbi:MAG: hypothetical protein AB8B79_05985 [Granulosicoccus sp.]
MNAIRNISFTVLCALLLSGCATQPTEKQVMLPQHSSNPIELTKLPIAAGSPTQTEAPEITQKKTLSLAKQLGVQDRSSESALSDLQILIGNLDEDADLCTGLVAHKQPATVPRVAKPPFMTYYKDPTFRSKVIRISNTRSGEVIKPMYSTIQAWNADETLMILYHTGGRGAGHHLYDGKNYQHIRNLNIAPTDLEQVFWSHTEPDYYYYISQSGFSRNHLLKANARTKKVTKLVDLSPMCGFNQVATAGNDVQMQSRDDDLFAFRCKSGSNNLMYMHSYRVSTGEINSRQIGPGTTWDNWSAPNPAASGKRLLMNGRVISSDLTSQEQSLDMANFHEHSSVGQTKSGDDALFTVAFDPSPARCGGHIDHGVAHLVEHNLESGECRALITESMGYPYTSSGTHISAVAHLRPGWVLMSSLGYPEDFARLIDGKPATTFFSEIYLTNTDPNETQVCRVAQHRSFGKAAKNGNYQPYFGEPHATLSPSGTRLMFGSDWYDSGSVDTYIVELPVHSSQQ